MPRAPQHSDLHVTVHEGGPRRFVLIHGSMDREGGFARLTRHLRPLGSVVTYDRRGYGRSLGTSVADVDRHVEDLVQLIGEIPTILVGHSLGGVLALAAATRPVAPVVGVVVYEPPMGWEPWWTGRTAQDSHREGRSDADVAEAFMRRFVGEERWNRLPVRTREARRAEGPALVAETVSLSRGRPWDPDLLRCPVMAGSGSLSREDFRRAAREIGDTNSDCRWVEIEGAHHNAHSTAPDAFHESLVVPLVHRLDTGGWESGG